MLQAKQDLDSTLGKIYEGGGAAAKAKHLSRGKMLPRDRIAALLDAK